MSVTVNLNNTERVMHNGNNHVKRIYGPNNQLLWSEEDYFTIEVLTTGTIWIRINNATGTEVPGTFYYWINKLPNTARNNYDGSIIPSGTAQYIRINGSNPPVGTIIRLYRAETTALCFGDGGDNGSYIQISGTAETKVSGNLASLIGFSETLPSAAFRYLFYSSNIVDADELILPWKVLSPYCFIRMFFNNQKLTKAPVLPAITLASNSYTWMFRNCTALTTASIMFCKDFTINSSCTRMYELCENLNSVTCFATSISNNPFNNWLNGVAATGTFTKKSGVTWPSGASGIPSGWTIEYA